MTDPKKIDAKPAVGEDDPGLADDGQETSADQDKPRQSSSPSTRASQPASGRKAPGSKDAIPFKWKLVGKSRGVVLTLFKAVEREEVEAQLRRAHLDGYYTDLQIVDVDVVAEPAPAPRRAGVAGRGEAPPKTDAQAGKPARTKRSTEARKAKTERPKAQRPRSTAAAKVRDASKPSARPARKKKTTTKTAGSKTTPKPRKRKTAAKSTKRRTSKKK